MFGTASQCRCDIARVVLKRAQFHYNACPCALRLLTLARRRAAAAAIHSDLFSGPRGAKFNPEPTLWTAVWLILLQLGGHPGPSRVAVGDANLHLIAELTSC